MGAENWITQAGGLALFGAGLFLAGAGGFQLSGFFPAAARPLPLREGSGPWLIRAGLLVLLLLLLAALRFAWLRLDLAAAVIVGGLALLAAPLALQAMPKALRDGRAGLGLGLALNAALALGLAWA